MMNVIFGVEDATGVELKVEEMTKGVTIGDLVSTGREQGQHILRSMLHEAACRGHGSRLPVGTRTGS